MNIENRSRIIAVYGALEELAETVVFVGGATTDIYADRPAAETRPTEDVDILIELIHYSEYAALEEKLRKKGFINDAESQVICRYRVRGVIVDVMPTSENVLGFTNKWYEKGYATAVKHRLDERCEIKIFHSTYFLASKMEAYNQRGGGDGRFSSDFEDMVYVLNNRNAIWEELNTADSGVAAYLKEQFRELLSNPFIDEWISVHLEQNEQKRLRSIIGELENFISG